MSNQLTEQSRLHAGVTRRTALRGAAWTASAVTVVVATPNIAAASTVDLTGDVTPGKPWKASEASIKHVYWEITVKNTSSLPMTGITVDFSFADNGGGTPVSLTVTGGGSTWTIVNAAELIAAFNGTIPAGQSITFRADFVTPNNAAGNVSAIVMAGGTVIGTTGQQGF
jgi:hypothetical protein